jgi:hypothetical protein
MNLLIPILLVAGQCDTLHADLRRVLTVSVRIEALEGRYLSITIDSVPVDDPAARLVNGHRRIFDYLLTNAVPPQELFMGVSARASDAARTQRFIENFLRNPAAASALAAYYHVLQPTGVSTAERFHAPIVDESKALTIASRFFYPARIVGDTVQVYRCTGINGVTELGADRNFMVEAFAFATIFDADSAAQINREFRAARVRVQRYARQGTDTAAALRGARAEMYEAMTRSEGLKHLLREAYASWRGTLPFRVSEWER